MKKVVLQFGLLAVAILALLQLSKFSLQYQLLQKGTWIPLFGFLFLLIGVGISYLIPSKQRQKIAINANSTASSTVDHKKIETLGISKREYEVLQKIAEGYSNQEIAQLLFISESTVKTHVSNILSKLDAKRRTQAVKNAKTLEIL